MRIRATALRRRRRAAAPIPARLIPAALIPARLIPAGLAALGAALSALPLAAAGGGGEAARFAVTDEVINPDLPPLTATIGAVGNGRRLMSSRGFEPIVYRNAFLATADSPDRVIAEGRDIAVYSTLRSGALDGAEVEILRLENGALKTVRLDRVAEGGFHADDWGAMLRGGRMAAPDRRSLELVWEPWYRPGAETWFTVRAVGADGAMSPPSATVHAPSPEKGTESRRGRDLETIRFKGELTEGGPGAPPAPREVRLTHGPDGAPRIAWEPGRGGGPAPAGYLVMRASTPPGEQRGHFLELAGGDDGPAVRAGDLVMLRKEFREISRRRITTDRVWDAKPARRLLPGPLDFWSDDSPDRSWTLREHDPDTPVEDPGRTYLELSLGFGARARLGGVNHGGLDQDWYDVLRPTPYRVEAWLRSERPGRAVFRFIGPSDYTHMIRPIIFETGPEWRKVSAEFTPPKVLEEGRGGMVLDIKGPGTVSVDNFRVYRADAPFLDLPAEDYARLEAAGRPTLRTHGFIKTGRRTYDLEQLTNPAGLANGGSGGNTLPQILGVMERAGVDPWLQIEPHFSREEWLGLVEYLAAPAGPDRPWAEKRRRQGREAPWTEAFDRILFEVGNETWNSLFDPWTFTAMRDAASGKRFAPGEVYGLFQERVISILRSSPWWEAAGLEDKVEFVLGGHSRSRYGEKAARRSPSSRHMTVASYIGGWDERQPVPTEEPESYARLLSWVMQSTLPTARLHARLTERLARRRGAPLDAGTYESGPGYVIDGLRGVKLSAAEKKAQERVMKSQAAGVATLDNFLAQAAAGYRLQNIFAFSEGDFWSSHAPWHRGGQPYPHWQLLTLLNREGLGDMLRVRTLSAPRTDLKGAGRRLEAVKNAPLAAAYATRRDDRLALFVISRRIPGAPGSGESGCTPVEVSLPFETAERVTLHRMAGPYDADNVMEEQVKIESLELDPPADPSRFALDAGTGAERCGLPPASAFLYIFEGVR